MICKDVERDFGEGFSFAASLPVRGDALVEKYSSGCRTDTGETFRSRRIVLFENEAYPKVVRLTKDIPAFDSGDREYDSWHDLFLAMDRHGCLHGLYATGGYRVAKMIDLGRVLDYPQELRRFF